MAQQGPNHQQAQPLPDENPGIFTWRNIRWFLAELLSKSMLFIGAITSATGGFKGIPILLTLYPLNLIAVPTAIVTMLCVISAISGFTVFWSSYIESLTPYCYRFIDFLKNLFTFNWSGSEEPEAYTPSKDARTTIDELNKELYNISEQLTAEIERKKFFSRTIPEYLNNLRDFIGDDRHGEFTDRIIAVIYENVEEPTPEATEPEPESNHFANFIYAALQILVKCISVLFVIFGCLVVIGIGILTNQGFLDYAGITAGGVAMGFCVIAAIMKQVCQLSFGAEKQFNTICSFFKWFGIHIENDEDRKIQKKTKELEAKQAKLEHLLASTEVLTNIQQELDVLHQECNLQQRNLLGERRTILTLMNLRRTALLQPAPQELQRPEIEVWEEIINLLDRPRPAA